MVSVAVKCEFVNIAGGFGLSDAQLGMFSACSASGRMAKCELVDRDLGDQTGLNKGGCRYACHDGTVWWTIPPCQNSFYKPWEKVFPSGDGGETGKDEADIMIPEWKELGIPDGYGPCRLLYNPPSGTLIAELRSVGEELSPNRIYTRHKDHYIYQPLIAFQPMLSSESVVTPLDRPLLFYMSNKLTQRERHYVGEWEGLYSFDIQERTSMKLASRDSLKPPKGYTDAWINDIVAVSPDAKELYLRIGAVRPERSVVDNQLVRMDLRTGEIEYIADLKGSFF